MRTKLVWSLLTLPLPWSLRRPLLNWLCGYEISPSARIGLSLVATDRLVMEEGSSIGHFTIIKSIDLVAMADHAKIGNFNWVTGIGRNAPKHFQDEKDRHPELLMGRHTSITGRHFIDCSNTVRIGDFTIIAGASTQILTHAIDIRENRQRSAPVSIGRYCFVGAACVVLKGATLPDYCVLAANSTLHKAHTQTHAIYSGVPAIFVSKVAEDAAYFRREHGYVA